MTYGSPASLDRPDVAAYLTRVRGGREPEDELADEFTRRYDVIGGSPLIGITRLQATALERALGWPVDVGMRFSAPSITDGLRALVDRGVGPVVGIILSPQFSPMLMGGYARDIDEARAAMGASAPTVVVAGTWHDDPNFVGAMARRIRDGIARMGARKKVPVLLTAHSIPRLVADQEPEYLERLKDTATAIAAEAGLESERWWFCWQSAGHEPGEWMTPDFADLMPEIARQGHHEVLVAPVQFLADHLEILYDIDVGAREQAEAAGLKFARTEALNDDPGLIAALASVAQQTLGGVPDQAAGVLGS